MAARGILTAPVPRHPPKRVTFLLDRARYCIARKAHLSLFRLLDCSLPADERVRREWLKTLEYLRSDCAMVLRCIDDLELVISTGQNGREYVDRQSKAFGDTLWLRRQLEGLDGGRAWGNPSSRAFLLGGLVAGPDRLEPFS